MRLLAAAVLLLTTTACATRGQPDPPQLPGSYALESINGHVLPATSPTEANIWVISGSLQLGSNGSYTLVMAAGRDSKVPATEQTVHGTYQTEDDQLVLTPGANSQGQAQRFRYLRAGTDLTLRDPQGNRFRFTSR